MPFVLLSRSLSLENITKVCPSQASPWGLCDRSADLFCGAETLGGWRGQASAGAAYARLIGSSKHCIVGYKAVTGPTCESSLLSFSSTCSALRRFVVLRNCRHLIFLVTSNISGMKKKVWSIEARNVLKQLAYMQGFHFPASHYVTSFSKSAIVIRLMFSAVSHCITSSREQKLVKWVLKWVLNSDSIFKYCHLPC